MFGDSGTGSPEQLALIAEMEAERDIAFALHTGDLAYPSGTYAEYERTYFGPNAALMSRIPFFATPGNHDFYAAECAPFRAVHSFPRQGVPAADSGKYYSFDWGPAHFTSLDSNLLATEAERLLEWLDRDLSATRQFWKVVFLHHPPFPSGHHCGDAICAAVRARMVPIVERHGVQLVLSGHEHSYQRTLSLDDDRPSPAGAGTTYVISGGGGAMLHDVNLLPEDAVSVSLNNYLRIDVDGSALTVRALGLNRVELDSFTLRPRPRIAPAGVVSVGDYTSALAPGSLVGVFGRNLASSARSSGGLPLPTELNGLKLMMGDRELPLLFVSPVQVNAQIPFDPPGQPSLRIVTANGSDSREIALVPVAPSILAVTYRDRAITDSNRPKASDTLVVYSSGLGRCSQPVLAGASAPGPLPVASKVEVWLGDLRIEPSYAGVTPGLAGVYQVNFTLPAELKAGNYNLRLASGTATSRAVAVPVN